MIVIFLHPSFTVRQVSFLRSTRLVTIDSSKHFALPAAYVRITRLWTGEDANSLSKAIETNADGFVYADWSILFALESEVLRFVGGAVHTGF